MIRPLSLAVIPLLTACGGPAKPAGTTPDPHTEAVPAIAVEAAQLPFVVYDRDGRTVETAAMFQALSEARAVCIGEQHTDPHHHWIQLQVLDELTKRAGDGVELGLGFEMFQRPYQAVLDHYAAGSIDDRVLLAKTEWRKRWGYDWKLYSPMVRMAVERNVALVALNIEEELRKKFSKQGIDALTEQERARLPELDLENEAHKAWFAGVMAGHPGEDGGDDGPDEEAMARIYRVQVLWDETMADTAARWLAGGDNRRMVIFAGNGHCHDAAIVQRMARRGVTPAVSVRPVIDDGEGSADEAIREGQNDYIVVMIEPE